MHWSVIINLAQLRLDTLLYRSKGCGLKGGATIPKKVTMSNSKKEILDTKNTVINIPITSSIDYANIRVNGAGAVEQTKHMTISTSTADKADCSTVSVINISEKQAYKHSCRGGNK
jgi:hypothetical protein